LAKIGSRMWKELDSNTKQVLINIIMLPENNHTYI